MKAWLKKWIKVAYWVNSVCLSTTRPISETFSIRCKRQILKRLEIVERWRHLSSDSATWAISYLTSLFTFQCSFRGCARSHNDCIRGSFLCRNSSLQCANQRRHHLTKKSKNTNTNTNNKAAFIPGHVARQQVVASLGLSTCIHLWPYMNMFLVSATNSYFVASLFSVCWSIHSDTIDGPWRKWT